MVVAVAPAPVTTLSTWSVLKETFAEREQEREVTEGRREGAKEELIFNYMRGRFIQIEKKSSNVNSKHQFKITKPGY